MASREEDLEMYLQGNLQAVFDALYEMGMIEPVLEMDWKDALDDLKQNPAILEKIMVVVREYQGDPPALIQALNEFDEQSLSYLAMEVAREFADFHSRNEVH
jgi:hypothetical protein